MQTAFTPAQLDDPEIADAAAILRTCVHYGFCTAVCPTWVLLRDENDGPRGRIDLIRAMLEAGGAPDARTVRHIDRCLSCNSCMSTCAVKVDYPHLADRARIHIERHFKRPLGDRLLRALLAAVLPAAGRFRPAMTAARLARPVAGLLPARLAGLVRMAPVALPAAEAGPGVYAAEGTRRMRVALFAGCVQQVLAPRINAATIRLLTRHGCEVVVADAGCCGALTLHMGKEDAAKAAARRVLAAWSRELDGGGLDAVVVNASGCGTTVKDYGHLFARDAEAAIAGRVAAMTLDVTELMQRLGIDPPAAQRPLAVAYHDACSLRHVQKVTEAPRALLRAAGFVVCDVPEGHFCCGSAGTYNMLQPELARQLGARKAGHIDSVGAAAVAAGNLGCINQIAMYTELPVVHTVELLDWATGGPLPPPLADVALPEPATETPPEAPSAVGIW